MQNDHARRKPSFHEVGHRYPPFLVASTGSNFLSHPDFFAAFPFAVPVTFLVFAVALCLVFRARVPATSYPQPGCTSGSWPMLFEEFYRVFQAMCHSAHLIAPRQGQ